jgi:hypothetical protein
MQAGEKVIHKKVAIDRQIFVAGSVISPYNGTKYRNDNHR